MGEILIQRDEQNRISGLTVRAVCPESEATVSTRHFLQATATSMDEYLRLNPQLSMGQEMHLGIDRSTPSLNREIDAILATLLIGFRLLEQEYPDELSIHDEAVSVGV
ncbi:MAG: hypothetical protein U9Q23_00510 [Candidatus Bipolaricaulota bacterium]|nr:hypothetical protein [Candidatus Bipolaricaulota bacterium]